MGSSEREQFEAQMREDGYDNLDFLVLDGSDRYAYMETEWAYRGWDAARRAQASAGPVGEHRQGCEALGGYGHGVGACSCGAVAAPQQAPLTDEQIDDLHGEANRGFLIEREDYFKAFRDAERVHGISAGKEKTNG